MPLLNAADALYLGTQSVTAAMLGSEQVWPELAVPGNTVAPSITGALNTGSLLTATTGTWTNSPSSYAYLWQQYDGGSWTTVGTGSTFTPDEEDDYRVRVIATNAVGDSEPAFSAPVTVTEAVPPEGLEWAGGYRMSLAGNAATHATGALSHAYTDPLPAGSWYIEIESDEHLPDNRGGIWCQDTPSDPGTSEPIGQYTGTPSAGASGDGEWWWAVYASGDYVYGDAPNNSLEPAIRWGIAYNTSTRSVWVRQVWVGGASGWMRDGGSPNPATGTDPTAVFSGSSAARVGASASDGATVTIVSPASHYGSPPAGFTAI